MTARPPDLDTRAHKIGLYKRYFDLIAFRPQDHEVRVNEFESPEYQGGALIRFRYQGEELLARVTRAAHYANFEEMFAHEAASVNLMPPAKSNWLTFAEFTHPSVRHSVSSPSASNWSIHPVTS
jgi:ASC-1-like (ASCH) protein